MPPSSSISGGGSTRFRCRCFLHACDWNNGGRGVSRSTIRNHRNEDIEYYDILLKQSSRVPHELKQAIAWSRTRPEPIEPLKPRLGQPDPNAAQNVEALPASAVSTSELDYHDAQSNCNNLVLPGGGFDPAYELDFVGGEEYVEQEPPLPNEVEPIDDDDLICSEAMSNVDFTVRNEVFSGSRAQEGSIDSEDGASTATEDECKDVVRGTSRCAWLEEFLQGDGSDSDGEKEEEEEEEEEAPDEGDDDDFETPDDEEDKLDLGAIDPQVMRSLAPVSMSYESSHPPIRLVLEPAYRTLVLNRCCRCAVSSIRALDSDMSDKQYLHLIQEASVQKDVDPRRCLSMREMAEFVETASQLEAEWFDICIEEHLAFVGPHADQEVCGTLHKRMDTDPETKKKKTITERCTEPKFKTIRTRRGNLQRRPRTQAVFLDPVPRIKAMYGCQQQAKMLRSLHEEMTRFIISLRKAGGDPHAGGYSDVSSGQALARAFEAGVFNAERNGFFGLSTDGALVKENREGSFWIWTVTLYNIPIESGRYHGDNTYVLVIAPCATTTTDFDSFAFIILKRFKEAAREVWIFDSLDHTWFLRRGYILFFLADLMGQAKQSGFAMSRGTFPCDNCEMPSATKPNGANHYMFEDGQATYRGDRCVGRKKAAEEDTGQDDGSENSDGDGDNNERPQKRRKACQSQV